jgi:hypothetical protein
MILRGMIVYDYHYALTLEFCENGSPGAISHQGEAWDVRYHEKSYLEQYHIKVKPEMWDTMRNLTWEHYHIKVKPEMWDTMRNLTCSIIKDKLQWLQHNVP